MTDTLTPVLTAHWDEPDSFRLAGYERDRRVPGAAQGARDAAGRRDRHREELRAARPWRRRVPHRREVVVHPARRRQAALPHGQRRRIRAGHLQGRPADDGHPAHADRGRHHHLLRHQGRARVHLHTRRGAARRPAAAARGRRGLRGGLPRQEHPRLRLRPGHRGARRGRRLHLRRGDRAAHLARGVPRPAAEPAAVPGCGGPVREPHGDQQRRVHLQRAVDHRGRLGLVRRAGHREVQGFRHLLAVRARHPSRPVRGAARHHAARAARPGRRDAPRRSPAEVLDPGRLVDPAADRRAPGRAAGLRVRGRRRVDARHPRAADLRRDHLRRAGNAALDGVLPARVLRQVHAVPGGRLLAGAGDRADGERQGHRRGPGNDPRRRRQHHRPRVLRARRRRAGAVYLRRSSTSATRSSSTRRKAAARSTRPLHAVGG